MIILSSWQISLRPKPAWNNSSGKTQPASGSYPCRSRKSWHQLWIQHYRWLFWPDYLWKCIDHLPILCLSAGFQGSAVKETGSRFCGQKQTAFLPILSILRSEKRPLREPTKRRPFSTMNTSSNMPGMNIFPIMSFHLTEERRDCRFLGLQFTPVLIWHHLFCGNKSWSCSGRNRKCGGGSGADKTWHTLQPGASKPAWVFWLQFLYLLDSTTSWVYRFSMTVPIQRFPRTILLTL